MNYVDPEGLIGDAVSVPIVPTLKEALSKLRELLNKSPNEDVGVCKPLINFMGSKGNKEHTKGKRPSTKGKHEKGRSRAKKDRGGEKGDKRRPYKR